MSEAGLQAQWERSRSGGREDTVLEGFPGSGRTAVPHPGSLRCPPLIDSPGPSAGRPRHPALGGHFLFSAKFICMAKQKNRLTAIQRSRPPPRVELFAVAHGSRARPSARHSAPPPVAPAYPAPTLHLRAYPAPTLHRPAYPAPPAAGKVKFPEKKKIENARRSSRGDGVPPPAPPTRPARAAPNATG